MRVLCKEHGPPNGQRYTYVIGIEPASYPDTDLRCDRTEPSWCDEPGIVYLTDEEYKRFDESPGRGFLNPRSVALKVHLRDKIIWENEEEHTPEQSVMDSLTGDDADSTE